MKVAIENRNPYGLISEARLLALEKSLGATLPADYRAFLLENNGGNPTPAGFWIVEGSDGSEIHNLFGLHDGPNWLQLDRYTHVDRGIPEWLFAIGDDGLGDLICISLSPDHRGQVFFIDHEVHPFSQPETPDGITKIADSFSEFIESLQLLPP